MVGQIEGEATIRVDYDTKRLGPQMEKTVKMAGAAGEDSGEAYVDGFTKKYTPEMKKEFLNRHEKTLDQTIKTSERKGTTAGTRYGRGFGRGSKNFFSKLNIFSSLDDEVKLVIGLLAATFSETAALTSGLASNIVALGAGLFQAAGGLSAIAATLPGIAYGFGLALNGLERVNELAPKAAAGIDNLKDAFENADVPFFMAAWEDSLANFTNKLAESLRFDSIAQNLGEATASITDAFADIIGSPAWTSFVTAMESSIPDAIAGLGIGFAGLTSAFLSFSAAAGPAAMILGAEFAAWGQSIADAVQAANESGALTQWLIDAGEILGVVLDLVGNLGTALFNVFQAAAPAAETILTLLADLAGKFAEWTGSLEGQNALAAWFDQGIVILNALLPLVEAVAVGIADLVTPEVVAQLVTFINSLTSLIPIVTQVLGLFSDLNVLGIVAALFDAIRVALEPVMPQLSELASTLGEALITAIVGLSPLLSALVQVVISLQPALVALLPPVADLIAELGTSLAPIIADLAPLIVDLLDAFIPLVPELMDALIPAIKATIDSLGPMVQIIGAVLPPILNLLIVAIRPVITILSNLAQTVFPKVSSAAQFTSDVIRAMKPLFDTLNNVVKGMQRPFQVFVDALNSGKSAGEAFGEAVSAAFQWVKDAIDSVKNALRNIRWPTPPSWITNGIGNITRMFATGGVVNGPTRAIIGEAGPEMVVPLARPLSQVDPAVRDVAAYAQGRMPAMARGGIAGGGVTVDSITVVSPWANNPRLIAQDLLDALVLEGK